MSPTLYRLLFTSANIKIIKMERLFEGKVVLVTSAACAIGREVAFSYATNGAFVIVSDKADDKTVNKIKANGGNAVFIKSDVSQAPECKRLLNQIISIYGRLDIACNNGGVINNTVDLIYTYLAGILKVISPKKNNVFNCMKYEIEAMLQHQGGVIINLSSLKGSIAPTSPHTYFSHKDGLSGIGNEILKNSDKAIRINCIAPGFTDTSFPATCNQKHKQDFSYKNKNDATKNLQQVADLVMWLSSEKASFSTKDCFPEYVGYMAN